MLRAVASFVVLFTTLVVCQIQAQPKNFSYYPPGHLLKKPVL